MTSEKLSDAAKVYSRSVVTIVHTALFSLIGITVLYFQTTVHALFSPNCENRALWLENRALCFFCMQCSMAFRVTVFPLMCMASILQELVIHHIYTRTVDYHFVFIT